MNLHAVPYLKTDSKLLLTAHRKLLEENGYNLLHLLFVEGMEYNDFINPV